MARLIAVSIDCRNEAARQTFEEIVSSRRGYLVTKGQGTGAVDMLLLELDEVRPQQTFAHVRELLEYVAEPGGVSYCLAHGSAAALGGVSCRRQGVSVLNR